jgi:hypothetical protein
MLLRIALLLLFALPGCAPEPADLHGPVAAGQTLLSTVARRGLPQPVVARTPEDPREPAGLQTLLNGHFGDTVQLAGEPHQAWTEDDKPAPAMGPNAKSLVRFVHLADTQLVDDESPARNCVFDAAVSGAFRPQEGYGCQLLDAAVRAVNALHEAVGVDFVLTGGDNVDDAQRNELQWFGQVLSGGQVECDSGADDGDKPGLAFAQKRAFAAQGLNVPWYWVSGNHDVLVTGVTKVDEAERLIATGTSALSGARDYRQPGAPVTTDDVPADALRLPLYATEIVAEVKAMADGAGPHQHGLATVAADSPYIQYRVTPVPDQPVDLIVLDSNAHSGGSDGLVFAAVFEKEIRPMLDASQAAGHWAIVVAHHPTNGIGDGGDPFGTSQLGTMTPAQFRRELSKYPNVLFYLAGHSHLNHIKRHQPQDGDVVRPFFEVQTASLADWPSQMRYVEIIDADNGYLAARLTAFDTPATIGGAPTNDLVAEALQLMTLDRASDWDDNPGEGALTDRNMVLWLKKPTGM